MPRQQDDPVTQDALVTFEDLAIDESLNDIERIILYVKSSIPLQRLVHVKMMNGVHSNDE